MQVFFFIVGGLLSCANIVCLLGNLAGRRYPMVLVSFLGLLFSIYVMLPTK